MSMKRHLGNQGAVDAYYPKAQIRQGADRDRDSNYDSLGPERLFDGTIQLSLCLGFPRRPLSAGADRRNRPKATDAAHAFDRRPLFFKHLTAARFAEL